MIQFVTNLPLLTFAYFRAEVGRQPLSTRSLNETESRKHLSEFVLKLPKMACFYMNCLRFIDERIKCMLFAL